MSIDQVERPWSVLVALADIPDGGGHYELAADAPARDAVAKLAGVRTLSRLEASFDVSRRGEAVAVRGEVRAQVGQLCVVTLEPIENEIREPVDLLFAPMEETSEPRPRAKRKGEPAEPLAAGVIDLGVVATEFLVLGVDPYPRKPGAEFSRPEAGDEPAHPFAALEALKKSQ